MANKLWLNSDGKILVNSDGKAFYTESCCCGSCTDWYACWQEYETIAVDSDGNEVWGENGTYDFATQTWTVPVLVDWQCLPADQVPQEAAQPNRWVMDPAGAGFGTAHIWTLVSTQCNSCDNCDVPNPPPVPGWLGNCTGLGGDSNKELPHYDYNMSYIHVVVTGPQPTPARDPDDPLMPDEDDATVSEETPIVVISEYDWPVINASNIPQPGAGETVTYGIGPVRLSRQYLANITSPYMPFNCCADEEHTCIEHELLRSRHDYGSYQYLAAASARIVDETGTHDVISANGAYYALPGVSGYSVPYCVSWCPFYMQQDQVYRVRFVSGVPVVEDRIYADVTTKTVVYGKTDLLPGAIQMQPDLWGDIYPSQAINPSSYAHIGAAWEARGASNYKQLVPNSYIEDFPLQGDRKASPWWFYQPYVYTDYPLSDVNGSNWAYATLVSDSGVYAVYSASLFGKICFEYRNLWISAMWGGCPGDSPRGTYCKPTKYSSHVEAGWAKWTVAARNSAFWNRSNGVTVWLHETDTPTSQGYRTINSLSDEHAYKIYHISIDNFPTWFTSNQCSNYEDGLDPEVPRAIFDDRAYYCDVCNINCDQWPIRNRYTVEFTHSCSYPSMWEGKGPIPHIGWGVAYDCWCTNQILVNKKGWRNGAQGWILIPVSNLAGASICPNWHPSPVAYAAFSSSLSCAIYTRNGDGSITTNWYEKDNTEKITHSRYTSEEATYSGNINVKCHAGTYVRFNVGSTEIHTSDGCYATNVSMTSAGYLLGQWAELCCRNGQLRNNNNSSLDRQIKAAVIGKKLSCLDDLQKHSCVVPAGTKITFTGGCLNYVDAFATSVTTYDHMGGARWGYLDANDSHSLSAYSRAATGSGVTQADVYLYGEGAFTVTLSSATVKDTVSCARSVHVHGSNDTGENYDPRTKWWNYHEGVSSNTFSDTTTSEYTDVQITLSRVYNADTGLYSLEVGNIGSGLNDCWQTVPECASPYMPTYAKGPWSHRGWYRYSSTDPWTENENTHGVSSWAAGAITLYVSMYWSFALPNKAAVSEFCCETFPMDDAAAGSRPMLMFEDNSGTVSTAEKKRENKWTHGVSSHWWCEYRGAEYYSCYDGIEIPVPESQTNIWSYAVEAGTSAHFSNSAGVVLELPEA